MLKTTSKIVFTLAALAIGAVLTPPIADASTSRSPHEETRPLTLRVVLTQVRVRAGTPIKGTVLITNKGSKKITVQTCARNGWLSAGLGSKTVPFNGPGFFDIQCRPTVVLKPGANRYPVTVSTRYGLCSDPGSQTTTTITPLCVADSTTPGGLVAPPLPPGSYRTKLVTQGLSGLTSVSHRVEVTLIQPGQD